MKLICLLALTTLTLGACTKAKKTKINIPMPDTAQIVSQARGLVASLNPTVDENFKLSQSYLGRNLVMIFPHDTNWGWVNLGGNDAKTMYDVLRIEATEGNGNEEWMPSSVKTAENIVCLKMSRKEAPENVRYSCNVYIEYKAANVIPTIGPTPVIDATAENAVIADYAGENLKIDGASQIATISFKGADAQALYNTIEVPLSEIDQADGPYNRKVNMIDCRSGVNVKEQACSIRVNAATGVLELPEA